MATELATRLGSIVSRLFGALADGAGAASLGAGLKDNIPIPPISTAGTATLDWQRSGLDLSGGGLPVIGGIITAIASLDLSIAPDTTITGNFALNANLPSLALAVVRRVRHLGLRRVIRAQTYSPSRMPTFEATAPRATTRTRHTGTQPTCWSSP